MSLFIDAFREQAAAHPQVRAFYNSAGQAISYRALDAESDAIAAFLLKANEGTMPVAIYGHKAPRMLSCMLGCMKAGIAYSPLDTLYPATRIDGILQQLGGALVLATAPLEQELPDARRVVLPDELDAIATTADVAPVPAESCVSGDDATYILFTSGSTGKPKGVVQRADALDALCGYVKSFIPEAPGPQVHFNRAPFCFDMSLKNVLTALPNGHTVFSLEETAEASMAKTFEAFRASDMTLWFSTPTFVEMCLVDPSFNYELMPHLQRMVLGGEVLHNSCVLKFLERFPHAHIHNGYGPTETCVMVSDTEVTAEMARTHEVLPIGNPAPGTELAILDHATHEEVAAGETGEICIMGSQVGAGYYHEPEKTAAVFFRRQGSGGEQMRAYLSGDMGYLGEDGMVYYLGRYDKQVKIRGYRVELGEIEETLNGLPEVDISCVLAVTRMGSNVALQAHVVPAAGIVGDRPLTRKIKAELKETLPDYMIPRTIRYHEELPLTVNGKIDRKALEQGEAR